MRDPCVCADPNLIPVPRYVLDHFPNDSLIPPDRHGLLFEKNAVYSEWFPLGPSIETTAREAGVSTETMCVASKTQENIATLVNRTLEQRMRGMKLFVKHITDKTADGTMNDTSIGIRSR